MKHYLLLAVFLSIILLLIEVPLRFHRNIYLINVKKLAQEMKPIFYLGVFVILVTTFSGLIFGQYISAGTEAAHFVVPSATILSGYGGYWLFTYILARYKGYSFFIRFFVVYEKNFFLIRPSFFRKLIKTAVIFANTLLIYAYLSIV